MKSTFLAKLQRNGILYLIGAFLLLIGIPFYQLFLLSPLGYTGAFGATGANRFALLLSWIHIYMLAFIVYRVLLCAAFLSLLSFPFTLFRIIVAQEIMAQEEEEDSDEDEIEEEDEQAEQANEAEEENEDEASPMPPYAWRGKGFAIIAAWAGIGGLVVYLLGTLSSTIYLASISSGFTAQSPLPANTATIVGIGTITTNTLGIGALALSTLFFGAVIARGGRNLWPGVWVAFGYTALAVAALLSGSAVAVASAPTAGQAALTTPAILLFAFWLLWFGVMLVRLKPE